MGRAFKYVVLGGGTAAGYAAAEFVNYGVGEKELCIISEEDVAPYERPALSKGFLLPQAQGAVRLPSFHTCVGVAGEIQVSKWYKDHGIELALGTRIVAADVKGRRLTTAEGETITYQTMIVATGARVLRLEEFGVSGADADNICYLRDLKDAQKMVTAMAACKKGKAVVIGGGYIGMECAAALALNEIQVTMVFPEPHCMARLFTPQIATFYEDYYKRKGIVFIKGTVMSAFEQSMSGKVVAVILKDGTRVPADMVVVGVGIRPNISLFENQLTIEKGGIKVDGKMKSSNANVYAVGDVASFPLKLFDDIRRLEHVDHSRKSAAHAVRAIMAPDKTADYDNLPFFYSRVFTLSWQFYGDNLGEPVFFGDLATGKFGTFWVEEENVVGVFLEGGNSEEYEAIARVARIRPPAGDLRTLSRLGLNFAFKFRSTPLLPSQQSAANAPTLVGGVTASHTMQACLGVAVAAAVVVLACQWYRKRRWRSRLL